VNQKNNIETLLDNLKRFKNKYYLNELIKGLILSLSLLITIFVLLSFTEYQLRLNSNLRLIFLVAFAGISLFIFIKYIIRPVFHLTIRKDHLSDEKAARLIGRYFPEVEDKLLNILQLKSNSADNALIQASILQKSEKLSFLDFRQGISIKKSNRKYFPYIIGTGVAVFFILQFAPQMLTEGSYRIIKYDEDFAPVAPFNFKVLNKDFKVFENEAYTLKVALTGSEIPQDVYLLKNELKYKMRSLGDNTYEITFNKIQSDILFQMEAAGFRSVPYTINVSTKPAIVDLAIALEFPAYTGIENQRVYNNGDLLIPEGTKANWFIKAKAANKISLLTADTSYIFEGEGNAYVYRKTFKKSTSYQIALASEEVDDQRSKSYQIQIIKDKFPKISLTSITDSLYYERVLISGEVKDDYGFSSLTLKYFVKDGNKIITSGQESISINKDVLSQKYYFNWDVKALAANNTHTVEYYTVITDNDGVNGMKSSKSGMKVFKKPSNEAITNEIAKNAEQAENQLSSSIEMGANLNDKLAKLDEILKTQKELSFEDRKFLEDLMKERQELDEKLADFKQKLAENAEKREKFEKSDKQLDQKSEQLQQLMDEMLKKDSNDLMEKIEELFKEKQNDTENFREAAEELQKSEKNRLKEMARLMELFKRLEVEYELNQLKNELTDLAEEQQKAAREEDLNKKLNDQQNLNDQFEEVKKDLETLKEKNQELKQPNAIENTKDAENDIDQAQQESTENLKNNQPKKASEKQQKAGESMKQMAEMMQQIQEGMSGGEQMQENMDNIRDIVDNLLKLSYRQEALMKAFREVNASDPRFLTLSEEQLTIKDDAVIIEDSLTSLAGRVFQLKNFITREMTDMNENIEKSINALQVRNLGESSGYQQFSMRSMNNLALLLDDILEDMQMQMMSQGGAGSESKNQQMPSPGERQKSLNQTTQQLSKEQQSGRSFSESIAELAAEQSRIRKQIQEMSKQMDQNGGKNSGMGELAEEMEEIEEQLVNKKLNAQLIERQNRLVTKLLEAEKAKKEQEEDDERKGEAANQYEKINRPAAFEKYLNQKRKELEQIQTIPPSLSPYYQKELDKYFDRIEKGKAPIN